MLPEVSGEIAIGCEEFCTASDVMCRRSFVIGTRHAAEFRTCGVCAFGAKAEQDSRRSLAPLRERAGHTTTAVGLKSVRSEVQLGGSGASQNLAHMHTRRPTVTTSVLARQDRRLHVLQPHSIPASYDVGP